MKLCKDCKHSVWPSQIYWMPSKYAIPMCGHPEARRGLVEGELLDACATAREDADYMKLSEPGCGREGLRFEQRPPPEPAASHEWDQRTDNGVMTFEKDDSPGFWARVARCMFGG